jgi:hypothetical protein
MPANATNAIFQVHHYNHLPHFLSTKIQNSQVQRNPPSEPKTPTLPLQPHLLSLSLLLSIPIPIPTIFNAAPPPPLIPKRSSLLSPISSTPYSELPLLLPSLPELELALVCTRSKLLVELSLFANSEKLSRLTLVLLRLFTLASVVCNELPLSLKFGTAVVDIEREGKASEFGRLPPFREDVVPVRGRRVVLGGGLPWNAFIAWEFRNGIGGLLAGDRVRC